MRNVFEEQTRFERFCWSGVS